MVTEHWTREKGSVGWKLDYPKRKCEQNIGHTQRRSAWGVEEVTSWFVTTQIIFISLQLALWWNNWVRRTSVICQKVLVQHTWIWQHQSLFYMYMHSLHTGLRRLGGQQLTHQICLKLLNMIFLSIYYYLEWKIFWL